MIENHQNGPLCEGLILYCAEHAGSSPKKALKLFGRLRVFRTLQEKIPHRHESPAKQKGEKDPQETSTDLSFFSTCLRC